VRCRFTTTLAAGVLATVTLGCNHSTTTVTGQVTYEGRPVQKGAISFLPTDGHGPSCGGSIVNGRYTAQLLPGTKMVRIVEMKVSDHILTREEIKQASAKQKQAGDRIEGNEAIPPNAEGNNVEIEVKSGTQTLDFALKRPTTQHTIPYR
jgi:hypothetical protein